MHCDDKRMLFVLEEQIKSCWEKLRESGYQDELLLKELNDAVIDYKDYKKSLESR